jgi:signal transduction histidine kinase
MVIASATLALLVGGAFAILVVVIDEFRSSARLATHSRQELTGADRLQKLVLDLETGQRGFVITHRERFLEPWVAARKALPGQFRALAGMVDDAAQARRLRRIQRDVQAYVTDYSVPLVTAARLGERSARSVAATEEGKRRIDAIRGEFAGFIDAEREILNRRGDRDQTNARRAVVLATAGLAGSVVLILAFAGYLTRAMVLPVRRAAHTASRLAGGDLAVRMPETGVGEMGDLERAFNHMGSSLAASRRELEQLAGEQASLRRVATLVARGASPDEVFGAVAAEMGQLLGATVTTLLRYEADGTATVAGVASERDVQISVGMRVALEGDDVAGSVLRTGAPVRITGHDESPASSRFLERGAGLRSAIAAPVVVERRGWGAMVASWEQPEPPAGGERRMPDFTELLATAIANADSRAQLTASRARVVVAADETRRRIERDLHDGIQQRLVSLGLELRAAEAMAPPEQDALRRQLARTAQSLGGAIEDLREISRGIHPAILSEGGLEPALRTLARRAALPVELDVHTAGRMPQPVEVATYYVISEALTNAVKHAHASAVHVEVDAENSNVRVAVRDDGVGGAEFGKGSGLIGLRDRVEALGGEIHVGSPPGNGTLLRARIPLVSD